VFDDQVGLLRWRIREFCVWEHLCEHILAEPIVDKRACTIKIDIDGVSLGHSGRGAMCMLLSIPQKGEAGEQQQPLLQDNSNHAPIHY
jgi:hypothetical protein